MKQVLTTFQESVLKEVLSVNRWSPLKTYNQQCIDKILYVNNTIVIIIICVDKMIIFYLGKQVMGQPRKKQIFGAKRQNIKN